MKFKFSLESLLRLRLQLEEQKEIEYGQILQKLQEAKEKLHYIEEEQKKSFEHWREKVERQGTVSLWKEYQPYLQKVKRELEESQRCCSKLEIEVENKRQDLLEAVRQRKTIESLKEKDFEAFQKEVQRQEQKVVDELVTFQYYNRQI